MKQSLATLSAIFLAGCSLFGIQDVEEARYQVLEDYGDIQIRRYHSVIIAQTKLIGSYNAISKQGFYRLFDYISGKNTAQQKIAMTAPVLQEQKSEKIAMTAPVFQEQSTNGWLMAFVLPNNYTLDTAPKPLDPTIQINALPSKKTAVLNYSGVLSETAITQHANQLETWLKQKGYKTISTLRSAGFDPPWTLPFLRRNEIHIDIE